MFNQVFIHDLPFIVTWWAVLFLIGTAAFPLTRRLFSSWWDQGYILSKSVGLAGVSWIVWQLGSYKIVPFSLISILFSIILLFCIGILITISLKKPMNIQWNKIFFLELLFFCAFISWSFVKGHEADIRSLEKFMDYGFSRTIQQSDYFPPPDMWYAGGTINYYYFGHLTQAVLSTLSGIHLSYGYNLMLATLFAFCFSMSFGIGVQLYLTYIQNAKKQFSKKHLFFALCTGILAAYLVSLSGNMQTIYAFTQGYTGDNPPPFWTVFWKPDEFLSNVSQGLNTYWYANATRFIPFTIHEFPSYSFVVSDNHGHVFNIPFTLLALASLFTIFVIRQQQRDRAYNIDIRSVFKPDTFKNSIGLVLKDLLPFILFGLLCGVLLMTNALDGPIYLGIFFVLLLFQYSRYEVLSLYWLVEKGITFLAVIGGFIISAFPFLINFTSFASGLALNCPPALLANSQIGPFLFETVDKCQKSPLWMMWLLWGFFWFMGIVLLLRQVRFIRLRFIPLSIKTTKTESFLTLLFFLSLGLIFFAEFFYFKDIYPAHFRSNTMFKLGYQAFIICSILAAFVTIQVFVQQTQTRLQKFIKLVCIVLIVPQLLLVSVYPLFSVKSYFGNLEQYKGLNGLGWFSRDFPDDYKAMRWLEDHVDPKNDQSSHQWLRELAVADMHVHDNFFTSHISHIPTILEADGDSYTDYNRMSVFTGLPTIIGWGVHEWLWRGSYDIVAPRKEEVRELYETGSITRMKELIEKYNIQYVVVGALERQKFVAMPEYRFLSVGKLVYQSGLTEIYALDKMRE